MAVARASTLVYAESYRPIALRDMLIFLAISNFHFQLLELLGIGTPAGMLPIPVALIMAAALLARRMTTIVSILPYIIGGSLYFAALGFLGVGFELTGAYVTMMQTATMLAFLQYLLSLGPAAARDVIVNVQRILGGYIVLFTVLQIGILISGNTNLFEQVAGSNYVGMLTTYLLVTLFRRAWITKPRKKLLSASIVVNLLGQQRASLLINLFLVAGRYLSGRKRILILIVVGLSLVYIQFSEQINTAIATLASLINDYYKLALLSLDDLEVVIRRSVAQDEEYDASALIRAFSLFYVGSEVLDNPMSPMTSREYGYLWNSHNVILEYFKVGGLIFFVFSVVAMYRRCRSLIRGGYCTVNTLGAGLAILYSMLFNDLFIAFFLLSFSFEREFRGSRTVPAARRGTPAPPPARRRAMAAVP